MRNHLLPVPRSCRNTEFSGAAASVVPPAEASPVPLRFSQALTLRAEGPVSADMLGDALRRTQAALHAHAARHGQADAPPLTLELHVDAADGELPRFGMDERYELTLDARGARLHAANHVGLHWALRTLLQCLSAPVPRAVHIEDAPRFPWRGVLLDPARRFLPLPVLLQALEGMAALRLNVLHLHLSDDQGFRLASERFPLLGELGGAGQCYSHDDIRRLVDAAAARGIRVVPELDMPGHCQSWLVAYPDLAPVGQSWTLRQPFGIGRASLDPTRERTYAFIAELLDEVCGLFPDDYVHIGGDEVHPKAWHDVPHIQAFMAEHGFADQRALQHHFTTRVCTIVESLGRKAVAWDEVLGFPLPANLTVQAWRGGAARDRALATGRDVIFSSPYYLDLFYASSTHYAVDPAAPQANLDAWEDALGASPGFAPVRRTLDGFHRWARGEADAARAGDADAPHGRLIGGEGCLWGELVDGPVLARRLFSRLPALAERYWSDAALCDANGLEARLAVVVPEVFAAAGAEPDALVQLRSLRPDTAWLEDARALVECLEPLKWYARLLGDDVLASRAMGEPDPPNRPYDTQSRLDRLVDMLPPESLPARRWIAGFEAWRAQPSRERAAALRPTLDAVLAACVVVAAAPADSPERDVLLPLSQRVQALARAVIAAFDGVPAALADRTLSAPAGGMFVVFEAAVLAWLNAGGSEPGTREDARA